jgi:hypothetical protein
MSQLTRAGVAAVRDARSRPAIKIREARFEDYDQIAALEARYGLETKSYEEWSDLWRANPTYRTFGGSWPIGWVLDTAKIGIGGYVGNIPRSYEMDGEKITTAVTHAWVVESSYRSYSLLLLDRYFNQRNVDLHLSTTVNAQASEAFTSFGSLRTPIGAWDRSLFWVTNVRGFASSWAAMKGIRAPRPMQYAFSGALAARQLSVRRVLNAYGRSRNFQVSEGFDDGFDVFWDVLKRRNRGVLLADRSRVILEWHFTHAIGQKKLWVLTARKGPAISGYSIFCRQDNPRVGLKRVRLIDFQALDDNAGILLSMIAWALKKCREQGIHMFECIGFSPAMEEVLRKLGPQSRRLPCWQYYYKSNLSSLGERLSDAGAWQPSLYDGDSSL